MERAALVRRLADGAAHSGEALAREFGVTRAAVWKQIDKLRDWGLRVEATAGRGYRLERPIDLLDADWLRAELAASVAGIGRVDVFTELQSTNRYLLERDAPAQGQLDACLAEYQSAGRGRRGRDWTAPLGACLCLSVARAFAETPPDLSALSLAVGAVARRVLAELTGIELKLKWPNDLVHEDAKLGGILVELTAEAQGRCHVVTGLGINVDMPEDLLAGLCDWPAGATDLRRVTQGRVPSRNLLAARLIAALANLVARYPREGFAPHRDAWRGADYLRGKRVTVEEAAGQTGGTACGIADDGALLLELAPGSQRRIISGDVSVRTLPA